MSVRKRRWHTAAQAGEVAKRLGIDTAEAKKRLAHALRVGDAKLLEQYPPQEAWVVDYRIGDRRHIETFSKKKDADARADPVGVNLRNGVHVAPSSSSTVAEAGSFGSKSVRAAA